jgi:hypothetical protein
MSYCRCGGYLGSGGVDSYAGRWCNCDNPLVDQVGTIASSGYVVLKKHIPGDPLVTINPYTEKTESVTMEEILPILKEVAQFGVYEDPEDAYCVFCELGRFGDSSQGEGNHDDNCISLRAQNILKKLGI